VEFRKIGPRFLEFRTDTVVRDDYAGNGSHGSDNATRIEYSYVPTDLMADERYIMFSRFSREPESHS
jgi:hypothetical protein